MPEQLARRTVEIEDGVTLHYIEAGAGKPLLIIPSWSLSAEAYKHQLHALSGSRRVMALDMRGHGESSPPAHGYRVSRLAADVRALIDALDLGEVDMWAIRSAPRSSGAISICSASATLAVSCWSIRRHP